MFLRAFDTLYVNDLHQLLLQIVVAAFMSIATNKVDKLFLHEIWFLLNSTFFCSTLKIDGVHGNVVV